MLIGYFMVDFEGIILLVLTFMVFSRPLIEGSGRIVTPYIGCAVQDFSLHGVQY
jgi:hypothetical protein